MNLDELKSKGEGAPWKLIGLGALILCAVAYLIWSIAHTPPPSAGVVIHPAPAVTAPKIEGPLMKVPLRVVPKPAVERQFPTIGTIAPNEEVVDTAAIPATENGGSTITFTNITTGLSTTVFIPKAAPWFALEDRNELSAGMEWGSRGRRVPVEYRRDVLRVKNLHLVLDGGVKIPVERAAEFEWTGGARAAVRW